MTHTIIEYPNHPLQSRFDRLPDDAKALYKLTHQTFSKSFAISSIWARFRLKDGDQQVLISQIEKPIQHLSPTLLEVSSLVVLIPDDLKGVRFWPDEAAEGELNQ